MPPRQRRSLSMPRTAGRIHRDGLTSTATVLVEALEAAQKDKETAETFTHPFHTYPARLHPATARVLVDFIGEGTRGPILDPFCGSGTVLVEARANGMQADRQSTSTRSPSSSPAQRPGPSRRAGAARSARPATRSPPPRSPQARPLAAPPPTPRPLRKPKGFDPNARNRRLASWFAPHVRRELEDLAARIDELRDDDAELADILTACLSAILYKVCSRTSDTDATWIERNIARGQAARLFAQRIDLLAAGLDDLAEGPRAAARGLRARHPQARRPHPRRHDRGHRHLAAVRRHLRLRRAPAPALRLPRPPPPRPRRRRDRLAPHFEDDPAEAHQRWQKALAGIVGKHRARPGPRPRRRDRHRRLGRQGPRDLRPRRCSRSADRRSRDRGLGVAGTPDARYGRATRIRGPPQGRARRRAAPHSVTTVVGTRVQLVYKSRAWGSFVSLPRLVFELAPWGT